MGYVGEVFLGPRNFGRVCAKVAMFLVGLVYVGVVLRCRDKMDMFLVVWGKKGVGFGMPHDKIDMFLVVLGFDLELSPI